jgi:repressor LexA
MSEVHMLIPKKDRPAWPSTADVLPVEPSEMVEIPLLGWVAAGQPVEIFENHERVSVPAGMVVRRDCYALRVRGHSMIDDNIQDGDIIVIEKRSTAENGQSVVAMINGETVTLKRFYIEKGGVRLQPANPELDPIYIKNEDIRILGIVRGVIRTP